MKGEPAMKAPELDSIPTECRRCHRIFDDKDLVWIQYDRTTKWFVCDHCAEVIGYCNRMIDMLRRCQEVCKEPLEVRPEETPMQRAFRLSRENSVYGSFGRKDE